MVRLIVSESVCGRYGIEYCGEHIDRPYESFQRASAGERVYVSLDEWRPLSDGERIYIACGATLEEVQETTARVEGEITWVDGEFA